MLRAVALSNKEVQKLVADHYVPLKLGFNKLEGFPVDWPALQAWATAYKFSDGRCFTGCSVVSPDLEIQYGNTGSAMMWELFESTAYDGGKFRAMLREALARGSEERVLRSQRGVSAGERRMELHRFRKGVKRVVSSHGRFQLPPDGFSLEAALELF